MALFAKEKIREFSDARMKWKQRDTKMSVAFITRKYRSDRALEYAKYGLTRRTILIAHNIDQIFEIVPPESDGPDADFRLLDVAATILAS